MNAQTTDKDDKGRMKVGRRRFIAVEKKKKKKIYTRADLEKIHQPRIFRASRAMDFDEPDLEYDLTDSQENAYDEDMGALLQSSFVHLLHAHMMCGVAWHRLPRRNSSQGASYSRTPSTTRI